MPPRLGHRSNDHQRQPGPALPRRVGRQLHAHRCVELEHPPAARDTVGAVDNQTVLIHGQQHAAFVDALRQWHEVGQALDLEARTRRVRRDRQRCDRPRLVQRLCTCWGGKCQSQQSSAQRA